MKIGLLGILLVWLSVSVLAADPDLVGLYKCEGMNPEGDTYSGFVEIRKVDRRFQVRWILPNAEGELFEVTGIGIIVGGRLSVAYFAGVPTIGVYTVTKADPVTLEGEWASPPERGVFPERLTKLPAGQPVPAKPEKPPPDRKGEIKG